MGFFSSLFGGSSPGLTSATNNSGAIAGFATNQGEGDTTAASTFWRNILSGDQSLISKSLAPEISSQQGQISQQKKQLAEFGTRSGGTAGTASSLDATGRANITNLEGGLQSGAASSLASTGSGLLNTGLSAYGQQGQLSQLELQNIQNSLFGGLVSGITGTLGDAASGGLGKIPGLSSVI